MAGRRGAGERRAPGCGRLAAAVTRACGFSGARTETVLDLFCGVGALGLSVAAEAKAVRGWDIVPEAVADANAAAKANGIANAEFEVADLRRARRALESQRRTCPERAAGSERMPPATTKTTKHDAPVDAAQRRR